ncbi:MAG: hypothetical protein ACKVZJ_12825 [Phycisphaerales bacterium]
MHRARLTHRLTIRLSPRLAERLADAALRIDQDASAYVRELLRRELLATGDAAQRDTTLADAERARRDRA